MVISAILFRTEKKRRTFGGSPQFPTFVLIVSAHPYCARNSHATSCIERALSSKITTIGQMAIAITLRGFNDLGRSVTPIFLSMVGFLCRFSTFCEKMKIFF